MEILGIIMYSFGSVLMDVIDLLVETFKFIAYIITLIYMLNLIRKDLVRRNKKKKRLALKQKGAI